MNGWTLNYLFDDEEVDRWLMEFDIPAEHGRGPHSLSIPKWIINDWAAVYGYDVDNPEDLDAVAEQMIYFAYVKVVHYSRATRTPFNIYLLSADDARKAIWSAISELKARAEIRLPVDVELRSAVETFYSREVKSIVVAGKTAFDVIRDDIPRWVDRERIRYLRKRADEYRLTIRQEALKRGRSIVVSPERFYCVV